MKHSIIGRRIYSAKESKEHRAYITAALLAGKMRGEIVAECKAKFDLKLHRVLRMIDEARHSWIDEEASSRDSNRAVMIQRLNYYIRQAEGVCDKNGKWIQLPNYRFVADCLDKLCRIQGLYEPTRIDINVEVQASLTTVMATLSEEQWNEAYLAYQDAQRKAQAFDAIEVPALPAE